MKIYSVRLSEDGTARELYTNVKALYNGINTYGYQTKSVFVGDEEMTYNYENLLKAIKTSSHNSQFYAIAFITCENGGEITIVEHSIISK